MGPLAPSWSSLGGLQARLGFSEARKGEHVKNLEKTNGTCDAQLERIVAAADTVLEVGLDPVLRGAGSGAGPHPVLL